MLFLAWTIGFLAAFATICAILWLCLHFVRSLIRHWRSAPTGGCAFNPLQEFVQAQICHVAEVAEQRLKDDDEGAPPDSGRSRE